ncbi:hypothetical protein N0V85_007534 [Neurospora sp. IMI 360204]|nr:hypothetical protein N0V85_007534 [Neurospora sp. IMI 360204]
MIEDINQQSEATGIKDDSDQLTSIASSDQQKQPVDAPPAGVNPGQPPQGTMAPAKMTPTPTATTAMTRTTTKASKVTLRSLPREIRDMIWNEVLTPEDEIFATNISCKCRCKDIRDIQAHVHKRDNDPNPYQRDLANKRLLPAPPLAEVFYEFREYALRRYESAYRKVHSDAHDYDKCYKIERMQPRLQWLSRKAVRYMCLDPNHDDDDDDDDDSHVSSEESGLEASLGQDNGQEVPIEDNGNPETGINEDDRRLAATLRRYLYDLKEAPLGEDDVLLLRCQQAMSASKDVRLAILDLLTKAKDYQMKVVCDPHLRGFDVVPMTRWVTEFWGVFKNRAPGCDFDKFDKHDFHFTKWFVGMPDDLDIVRFDTFLEEWFSCKFDRRYTYSEAEETTHEFVGDIERQIQVVADCLKPFETLWAEGVKDIKSSRYGRMPKLGAVVEMGIDGHAHF